MTKLCVSLVIFSTSLRGGRMTGFFPRRDRTVCRFCLLMTMVIREPLLRLIVCISNTACGNVQLSFESTMRDMVPQLVTPCSRRFTVS
jgi:hypothetical protein